MNHEVLVKADPVNPYSLEMECSCGLWHFGIQGAGTLKYLAQFEKEHMDEVAAADATPEAHGERLAYLEGLMEGQSRRLDSIERQLRRSPGKRAKL